MIQDDVMITKVFPFGEVKAEFYSGYHVRFSSDKVALKFNGVTYTSFHAIVKHHDSLPPVSPNGYTTLVMHSSNGWIMEKDYAGKYNLKLRRLGGESGSESANKKFMLGYVPRMTHWLENDPIAKSFRKQADQQFQVTQRAKLALAMGRLEDRLAKVQSLMEKSFSGQMIHEKEMIAVTGYISLT